MKTILAVVGGGILALATLGLIGVGHFRIYYGDKPLTCWRGEA
ncbi:hypothetical protein [Paraburkholderia kururiensis]|nr:hypothetical protein [Paraburkholderia kururiensis]